MLRPRAIAAGAGAVRPGHSHRYCCCRQSNIWIQPFWPAAASLSSCAWCLDAAANCCLGLGCAGGGGGGNGEQGVELRGLTWAGVAAVPTMAQIEAYTPPAGGPPIPDFAVVPYVIPMLTGSAGESYRCSVAPQNVYLPVLTWHSLTRKLSLFRRTLVAGATGAQHGVPGVSGAGGGADGYPRGRPRCRHAHLAFLSKRNSQSAINVCIPLAAGNARPEPVGVAAVHRPVSAAAARACHVAWP